MHKCTFDRQECDAKYVLRVWFWRSVAIGAVTIVSIAFAGGTWKKGIEISIDQLDSKVSDLEKTKTKIDSIYSWTRPSN